MLSRALAVLALTFAFSAQTAAAQQGTGAPPPPPPPPPPAAKPPPPPPAPRSEPITNFVTAVPTWLVVVLAVALLALVAIAFAWWRERGRSRRALETALMDPLTGLANRVAFDQQLAIEWERFHRHDRTFGVMVLDLDGFKDVNDERGHGAGDLVLQRTAQAIRDRVRRSDFPARIGGDEFCVLTSDVGQSGLTALGESLRESIEESGAPVSIGWALAGFDEDAAAVLDRADAAMYADKRSRARDSVGPLGPEREGVQAGSAVHGDLLAGDLS